MAAATLNGQARCTPLRAPAGGVAWARRRVAACVGASARAWQGAAAADRAHSTHPPALPPAQDLAYSPDARRWVLEGGGAPLNLTAPLRLELTGADSGMLPGWDYEKDPWALCGGLQQLPPAGRRLGSRRSYRPPRTARPPAPPCTQAPP